MFSRRPYSRNQFFAWLTGALTLCLSGCAVFDNMTSARLALALQAGVEQVVQLGEGGCVEGPCRHPLDTQCPQPS